MKIPDDIQIPEGAIRAKAHAAYLRNRSDAVPDVLDSLGRAEYLAGIAAAKRELGEYSKPKQPTKDTEMNRISKEDSKRLNALILAGGRTISELAEEFGISYAAVQSRMSYYKQKSVKREISDEEISAAVAAEVGDDIPEDNEPEESEETAKYESDEQELEEPETAEDEPKELSAAAFENQIDMANLMHSLATLFQIVGNILRK